MPRKKKVEQPIGVGLTAKQMRRKKPINSDLLVDIEPLTDNQKRLFTSYSEGKHLENLYLYIVLNQIEQIQTQSDLN